MSPVRNRRRAAAESREWPHGILASVLHRRGVFYRFCASFLFYLGNILSSFLTPQGLAPTLMVARVALASPDTVVHANSGGMSDLEFQAQSVGLGTSIFAPHPQAGDLDSGSKSSEADEKRGRNETLTKEI